MFGPLKNSLHLNIAIIYVIVAVRRKEFKTALNVLVLVPISILIVHVITALQKRISQAIGLAEEFFWYMITLLVKDSIYLR